MSLNIDLDEVRAVLIDEWYEVEEDSFTIDDYEFSWHRNPTDVLQGDECTGYAFKAGGKKMAGPLSAIRALRYG